MKTVKSIVALGIFTVITLPLLHGQTLEVLHMFQATDGANPRSGLVQGSDGNFYGTTDGGGASGSGTIFKVTPSGALTTLVSLDDPGSRGLVQGSDGNFYGTASYSDGFNSYGTIFKVTSSGALTTLVSFNGGDWAPSSGLAQGSDGSFYGTTASLGLSGGGGTVFRMTSSGTLTTLVSFNGTNGYGPHGGLVQGSDGNFYGTTYNGGAYGTGTAFKMTPSGTLTTLVSFDGSNGASPFAGLVQGSDGSFYGTTYQGGANGKGTVFRLVMPPSPPSLNVVHSGTDIVISWPVSSGGFKLEESSNLSLTNSWSTTALTRTTNADVISVSVPTSAGTKFFRLATSLPNPHPYIILSGTYNGLFHQTDEILNNSAGFFTVLLTTNGAFFGQLKLGSTYPFSGQFDSSGHAIVTVLRSGLPSMTLALNIDISDNLSGQITGTVSDGDFTSILLGYRAAYNSVSNPAPQAGKYTVILPGTIGTSKPAGHGYGIVTVSTGGFATLSGMLADGTEISQSVSISKDGQWPFYVSLYSGEDLVREGLVLGWISLTDSGNRISGDLSWIKTGAAGGNYYPAGFTKDMVIEGSVYTPPATGQRAISLVTGSVIASEGSLTGPFTNRFSLSSSNAVTMSPPVINAMAFTITETNGFFSGSFVHPVTQLPTAISGVILQNSTNAKGFFLSTNLSGSILIE